MRLKAITLDFGSDMDGDLRSERRVSVSPPSESGEAWEAELNDISQTHLMFLAIEGSFVFINTLVAHMVKETQAQPLDLEDPLEKGVANHSSMLVWRIPWTEEVGGYSPWGHKESDTTGWLSLLFSWVYCSKMSPVSGLWVERAHFHQASSLCLTKPLLG